MPKKALVCIVGPNLEFGGVTRYLKDFAKRAQNHKITIFNTARPKKKKIRAGTGYKEVFNSGMVRSLTGLFITLWNLSRFPFFIIKNKIELVHICGVSYFPFWENTYYIFVARLLGKPVTLHYLGAFDQYYLEVGQLQRNFIEIVLKRLDHIFVLSKKVESIMSAFISEERLTVIPSSVDTLIFEAPDRIIRSHSEGVRILFVGGLDPFRKGIFDLLKAFVILLEDYPTSRLVLTGGDSFDTVKPKWEALGISDNIDFQGWISKKELIKLYSSCDILALPSYNEGLPYVVIEALSTGLPIIASNVGGIAEVVDNEINGFIIQPGEIEKLVMYLITLAGDDKLRRNMSHANRIKAMEHYSVDNALCNIEKTFDYVISRESI